MLSRAIATIHRIAHRDGTPDNAVMYEAYYSVTVTSLNGMISFHGVVVTAGNPPPSLPSGGEWTRAPRLYGSREGAYKDLALLSAAIIGEIGGA